MFETRLITRLAMLLVVGVGLSGTTASGKTRLQGAGATFPAPYYKRLVVVYQQKHPDVLIDYQSIGSGRRHPGDHG